MTNQTYKGLSVSVLRNAELGDCTRNGVSKSKNTFIIIGDGFTVDGPFTTQNSEDVLIICEGPYNTLRAVPLDLFKSGEWVQFGGNFVYTSDSRFSKINNGSPIKIFDRVEN